MALRETENRFILVEKNNVIKSNVHVDEILKILLSNHPAIGHKGRNSMEKSYISSIKTLGE